MGVCQRMVRFLPRKLMWSISQSDESCYYLVLVKVQGEWRICLAAIVYYGVTIGATCAGGTWPWVTCYHWSNWYGTWCGCACTLTYSSIDTRCGAPWVCMKPVTYPPMGLSNWSCAISCCTSSVDSDAIVCSQYMLPVQYYLTFNFAWEADPIYLSIVMSYSICIFRNGILIDSVMDSYEEQEFWID